MDGRGLQGQEAGVRKDLRPSSMVCRKLSWHQAKHLPLFFKNYKITNVLTYFKKKESSVYCGVKSSFCCEKPAALSAVPSAQGQPRQEQVLAPMVCWGSGRLGRRPRQEGAVPMLSRVERGEGAQERPGLGEQDVLNRT